ncbi:MAG: HAMP domain-containing histidine kinase [Oscillospiraceae bacterium]|nr:HAMP domain-containing histidine kinase [Oscillospiraceae bacterium]
MLIISSLLVFLISISVITIFTIRSYIKNKAESGCLIVAIIGFNLTSLSICLYYAFHRSSNYILNRFLFLQQDVLVFLRQYRMSLIEVSNLLNAGRLLFIVGIYCFVALIIDRKLSFKKDAILIFPLIFIILNISPIYIFFIRLLRTFSPSLFHYALNAFDNFGTISLIAALVSLTIRLIFYYFQSDNPRLKRSVLLLIVGLVLVWVGYVFIFDLTPTSMANVFRASLSLDAFTRVAMTAQLQGLLPGLIAFSIFIIVFSYLLLIFSSLDVLRHHNQQKVGNITFNKNISISNVQSLIPFLHTLKNHLVSLHQFESIMTKENFDETQPMVKSISKEISDIVDNIYDNSCEIKLFIVRCDVCECLSNAIESVQFTNDITIHFEHSGPIYAMVDPKNICHAFENILLNSADACSTREEGEIKIVISEKARFVKIIISDNGIGIAKENLNHIFNPFFSSKQNSQSWGMGLYHVSQVIKAHSGWIKYKSEPGVGTDAVIFIPTGK